MLLVPPLPPPPAYATATQVIRKTGMNAESSRSHLLIYVFLARREPGGSVVHSKLCLADLAGSERQSKAGTATASLAEGCAINKSLSALGNVLTALTEASGPEPLSGAHVPFRDSKLTRLLQDCLGGSALMTLVVCVSPDPEQAQETVSTLRFGSRCALTSTRERDTIARQASNSTGTCASAEGTLHAA